MSNFFSNVKVPGQDCPIGVCQIRALGENFEFIRRQWRNNMWNHSRLVSSPITMTSLNKFRTGRMFFKSGLTAINVEMISITHTGNVTVNYHVVISNQMDHSGTFGVVNRSNPHYMSKTITLQSPVSSDGWGYIEFTVSGNHNVVHIGLDAIYDQWENVIVDWPVQMSPASTHHVKGTMAPLMELNKSPQFIAGWADVTDTTVITKSSVSSPPQTFKIFALYSKSDDLNSVDKSFANSVGTSIIDSLSPSLYPQTINVRTRARENAGVIDGALELYKDNDMQNDWAIQAESYSTGSGTESVIETDVYRQSADYTLAMYLNNYSLHVKDLAPVSAGANANGDHVDPSYLNIVQGGTIKYTDINTPAQLLFNNVFLRAGKYCGIVCNPEGQSLALTTTLATIGYTSIFNAKNLWLSPKFTKGTIPFTVTMVVNCASSSTIEVKLINRAGGTKTVAMAVASGLNHVYISDSMSISTTDSQEYLAIQIRDKNTHQTVTLYSLLIALGSVSTTY